MSDTGDLELAAELGGFTKRLTPEQDAWALFAELSRRGWTETELRKLAGENLLRVMRAAEYTAERLHRERGPNPATIEELDGSVSQ